MKRIKIEVSDDKTDETRKYEKTLGSDRELGEYLYGIGDEYFSKIIHSVADRLSLTKEEMVFDLIKLVHPNEWIRSQNLQRGIKKKYNVEIKLSTISTYLGRFYKDKKLERRGNRRQWEYKIINESLLLSTT